MVRGAINEVYLDDLRAKTHRGMSGQVERGLSIRSRTASQG
jgi:site-specific DNA recombinase